MKYLVALLGVALLPLCGTSLWAEEAKPDAKATAESDAGTKACLALAEDAKRDESKLTEETKKKYEAECPLNKGAPLKALKKLTDGETEPAEETAEGKSKKTVPAGSSEVAPNEKSDAEAVAAAQGTLGNKTALEKLEQGFFPTNRRDAAAHLLAACRGMTVANGSPRLMSEEACANTLTTINKESSFRPTAQNPESSAYGLGQYINGTWRKECQKYLNTTQADCADKRDDAHAQMLVLSRSTQERLDKFNNGSLDCRGLSFGACNYAIYHHSGSWRVQEYVNRGLSYYNTTAGASQAVYRDAFARLSTDSPDTVMASMPLTRVPVGTYAANRAASGGAGRSYTIGGGTFTDDTVGGSMTGFNPMWQEQAMAPPSQNLPILFGPLPTTNTPATAPVNPTTGLKPNEINKGRIGGFEPTTEAAKRAEEEKAKLEETLRGSPNLRACDLMKC